MQVTFSFEQYFFIFAGDDDTFRSWNLEDFFSFLTLTAFLGSLLMIFLYVLFFSDRISLITKDETEESSVTSEEAEKVTFF